MQSSVLRSKGRRRAPNRRGVNTGCGLTSKRLNIDQITSIDYFYCTHPAISAARSILCGQLFGGGLCLKKSGNIVQLTPNFRKHIDEAWLPFCKDVLDCILKYGLVPVAYDEMDSSIGPIFKQERKRRSEIKHVIPMVPANGSYYIGFESNGAYGRKYCLYPDGQMSMQSADENARVFVFERPDAGGNVSSAMASVFESGMFVSALVDLALMSETARSRPHIVTQAKKTNTMGIGDASMFFDSESRELHDEAEEESNRERLVMLAMQRKLCDQLNKFKHDSHSALHRTRSSQEERPTVYDTDVTPSIFTLPNEHEMAPQANMHAPRGDLEQLMRLTTEKICGAFGVPADLIYGGRYGGGKATSQLHLLNTTVAQLATYINMVASTAYNDIYGSGGSGEDVGTLELLISPIASTSDVVELYKCGLVPLEYAMPQCMSAIGCSRADIEKALKSVGKDADAPKIALDQDVDSKRLDDTNSVGNAAEDVDVNTSAA